MILILKKLSWKGAEYYKWELVSVISWLRRDDKPLLNLLSQITWCLIAAIGVNMLISATLLGFSWWFRRKINGQHLHVAKCNHRGQCANGFALRDFTYTFQGHLISHSTLKNALPRGTHIFQCMAGQDISCWISKSSFEIPHKRAYPMHWKMRSLKLMF